MFPFYYIFIFSLFQVGIAQSDIEEGAWNVLDIKTIENEGYEFVFDITRKKLTRTEDAFSAALNLNSAFDETYGLRANVYKWVDGGSKLYQTFSDESFVRFLEKNAKSNVKRGLEMAGIDPPEFPIAKGAYELKDFVLDYCELPKECPCGKYTAEAYILKNTEEVGGLIIEMEFECGDDNKCANNE